MPSTFHKARQEVVILYLKDKMEATSKMIGEEISRQIPNKYSIHDMARSAAPTIGKLRKQGILTYLPDLNAWRLTEAGRYTAKHLRELN